MFGALYIWVVPKTWWIKHIWPTHSTPWPKEGALGDIPTCSDYIAIRADGWDPFGQEFHLLSCQLLFLSDVMGHIQSSAKQCWNSAQCDSCNDVTKDGSRNSKFGVSSKKETITFLTRNLYSYEILTDPRCNSARLLFLEYKIVIFLCVASKMP